MQQSLSDIKLNIIFRKLSVASLPCLPSIEELKVKAHLPLPSVTLFLAKLLNSKKSLPSTNIK